MSATKLKILFSGMIAADPHQGGATWAVLQYVLGLEDLGHDVLFVEPIPEKALHPAGSRLADSTSAAYFRQVTADFGLQGSAALLESETKETVGLPYAQIEAFARKADLLINISGMLAEDDLISSIPQRLYLDLDPAFIQLWHASEGIDMRFDTHTHFVTVGLALGSPMCPVPTCGRQWITTLQPIVLKHWPPGSEIRHDALTTIGNWRGYGSMEHAGEFYGQKAHSLRELITLPKRTQERFLLALAIHPDEVTDLAALSENGWKLVDPQEAAGAPASYREFIQRSKGEFGVAKSGYVKSRCGWFSDRSVCYLASGRPVVAQETGFSRYLPTGEGLFAFETVDEAVRCIDAMNENYTHHSQAARRLAETHFRSDKVLTDLLHRVGGIS